MGDGVPDLIFSIRVLGGRRTVVREKIKTKKKKLKYFNEIKHC